MKSFSTLRILLGIYILALSFTDLLHLPQLGSKLQFPELVFLPLAAVFFFALPSNFRNIKFNLLDSMLLGYGILVLTASLFSGHLSSRYETAGVFYLLLLYFITKTILNGMQNPIGFVVKFFITAGVVAATIGIFGWLMNAAGIQTRLVSSPDCYFLYSDNLMQATGFMNTPNLLHNLISLCLIFFLHGLFSTDKIKFSQWLTLLILIAGLIVTFSKSSVFLVIALLWFFQKRFNIPNWISALMRLVSVLLFIASMLMSHLLITGDQNKIQRIAEDQSCYTKEAWSTFVGYSVFPTNYFINKISAVRACIDHPVLGVGPGQFNSYVDELKANHLYPEYFVSFDPHCTYTGALAELGIFAFILLIVIGILFWKKISLPNRKENYWSITLKTCLIYFALEAINMDILNFRHLWIFLAVAASHFILQKNKTATG